MHRTALKRRRNLLCAFETFGKQFSFFFFNTIRLRHEKNIPIYSSKLSGIYRFYLRSIVLVVSGRSKRQTGTLANETHSR